MKTTILLLIHLVAWSTTVFAGDDSLQEFLQQRAVLGSSQVVHGDYFAFGPQVEISGTVNGDVYAVGGEVLVDGTVNGDLIVAGGKVTISGTVSQDVRGAGGQVTIGGKIGRNVTAGGGDVHVTDSAAVRENLLAGGGNVQLAGRIGRDARVGAGNVTVSNTIERDLTVAGGAVRLTSKATVGGTLRYWNETTPSIDEGAVVRGGVVHRPLPESFKPDHFRRGFAGMRALATIISFVSTLVLGLLVLWVYPVFTQTVEDTIRRRPGASLAVGGLVLAGMPVLVVFCLATLLGIPLGLVLAALYMVTLYLARVFVMVWAGRLILQRVSGSPSVAWAFVTGLVIYSLLAIIPIIGKVVTLVTILLGLGSLFMTKKQLVATLRQQHAV